jgi:PAS domain S-box-containing protein
MTADIRLLHVEDDPGFADLTATVLEREDEAVTVDTAASADDARDLFADQAYDCIVSDYDLPGESGIDLLESVRETDPTTPFILFTGKGSEEVASDAISAGATDYLQKARGPGQFTMLANRVQNAVSAARTERERERQLAAIETAHEGISILDDDEFVYVNAAYADLFGYDPEELIGEHWSLLYPDDQVQFAREEILTTVEREGIWRGDTTGLRADGTTFLGDHTVATSDQGDLICTIRDVTDRENRKAALLETNAVLRAILANLPVGVIVEDADGEVLAANSHLCDLLGLSTSEAALEGEQCAAAAQDIKHRFADPEGFVDGIDAVLAAGDPVFGETLELSNGDVLARDFVLFDLAGGTANLWLYRDVTDQHEHEAALELLQERTRRLMTTTTVEETAEIAVQSAMDVVGAQVTGFHVASDDRQHLDPIAFADTVRDEDDSPSSYRRGDDDPAAQAVWRAFEAGDAVYIEDTRDHGRLAEVTPVRSAIVRPLAEYGVFIVSAVEPAAFDETDRALVDIVAAALTAALERREREHELRRRNERLNEFAGIVSHDLRNPLTVALGHLAFLEDDDHQSSIDAIERALDRMGEIIDDTLMLAQEGRAVGDLTTIDLATLAQDCWADVATGDATIRVVDPPTIRGDRHRVKHVLENLFRNSVEHADESATVRVGALDDVDGFYVADDGPGIPTDARAHIFESGYSTSHHSTGFGLAIVQEIVEAHGWTITVTEAANGGARFEILGPTTTD